MMEKQKDRFWIMLIYFTMAAHVFRYFFFQAIGWNI